MRRRTIATCVIALSLTLAVAPPTVAGPREADLLPAATTAPIKTEDPDRPGGDTGADDEEEGPPEGGPYGGMTCCFV